MLYFYIIKCSFVAVSKINLNRCVSEYLKKYSRLLINKDNLLNVFRHHNLKNDIQKKESVTDTLVVRINFDW